jgi:hypothetical protein
VGHHGVPFFVAVEGFARVQAPAVLPAPAGAAHSQGGPRETEPDIGWTVKLIRRSVNVLS